MTQMNMMNTDKILFNHNYQRRLEAPTFGISVPLYLATPFNFFKGSRSCPDPKNMYLYAPKTVRRDILAVPAPAAVAPKS